MREEAVFKIPKPSSGKINDKDDDNDNSKAGGEREVVQVQMQMQMQMQMQLQAQESVRQRMRRHWSEVSGKVLIPDNWGKEDMLKDWLDYSSFDALLAPNTIGEARQALVAEGRRAAGSQRLRRIETRC